MAVQEGQGKIIAIVVLSVLWVASSVAAYIFYSKTDELKSVADAANKKASDVGNELNAKKQQYAELKEKLVANALQDDHKALMDEADRLTSNATLTAERSKLKPRYISVKEGIDSLRTWMNEADKRIAELDKTNSGLQEDLKKVKEQYGIEVAKWKEAADKAAKDLDSEKQKYMASLDEKEQSVIELNRRVSSTKDLLTQTTNNAEAEKKALTTKLRENELILESRKQLEELKNRVKMERPDGQIVALTDGGERAYINLGSADKVTHGQTFGIYGRDSAGNPFQLPKAKLEVVQVMDDHRALCKINDARVKEPVMPGDNIFNPIWDPGQAFGVAFVGLIYLDGDGKPDNEKFRRVIEDLGGRVDAYADPTTGKVWGRIGVNTKWLIEGEMPTLTKSDTEDPEKTKILQNLEQARSEMSAAARSVGVSSINLENFLTFSGWNEPIGLVMAGEENRKLFQKSKRTPFRTWEDLEKEEAAKNKLLDKTIPASSTGATNAKTN